MTELVGSRYKAIIFDMDNTILRSRIDFPAMKVDVFELLIHHEILDRQFPLHEHTIATLLESCRVTGIMSESVERLMWDRVAQWEREGMLDADLESGALELLEMLQDRYHLVILTNNARQAALDALELTGVTSCFEHIVGREQMQALKPSPSGIQYIMNHYPESATLNGCRWGMRGLMVKPHSRPI
jgi:phosphoglycolate phosphatase